MSDALSGLTILDFTRLLPGPLATLHFADHGANVIKVEDVKRGDYARQDMAFGVSMSHLFHMLNRGKRSIAIDLTQDTGREIVFRLLEKADIIVENFRPGAMARLGVGYDDVKAHKPDIIYCSISAYGATGPRAHLAAHDINMCGLAGVSDQIGAADGPPAPSNFQIGDIAGGSLSAINAILTALVRRERTGDGAYLDISITDALIGMNVMPTATKQTFRRPPERGADVLTGALACYGYYPTKDDRYMAVGALEPHFWRRFCEAIDRPDLTPLHLSSGDAALSLRETLTEIFRSRTLDEWTSFFDDVDCCVTPVLSPNEATSVEDTTSSPAVRIGRDPKDGDIQHLFGPNLTVDESAIAAAPRHGEHSHEILQEANYPSTEIEALAESQTIK
ncbi:MAG: CaiB/BaiF CoA-transferase family protein [Pseudomonadota bacterium]